MNELSVTKNAFHLWGDFFNEKNVDRTLIF